jgi:hypothetical protein
MAPTPPAEGLAAASRNLFRAAIFLASFLLFVSEPMAAKQLLPVFGGSAAVWITCLVFFQAALLAGYLYAHAVSAIKPTLHIALLAAATCAAFYWSARPAHFSGSRPALDIFASLTLSIGLPFVLLASTSPLLQVWLARLEANPVSYRLFALSNLASLLALFAYPTLIEPRLSLSLQRALWAWGVAGFAVVVGAIAWRARSGAGLPRAQADEPAPLRSKPLWFLLPMVAAMQLSAVTAHLTSNIAAIPLLWVLPLAVYLVTFILAFQFPALRVYRGILLRLLAVMLAALGLVLSHTDLSLTIGIAILFFLIEIFLACLFCHGEAYALRPRHASETTVFYLTIAAGGATGSFLIGIVAPLVFSGNYDLALTFLATALAVLAVVWEPAAAWTTAWPQRLLWATGSGLLVFLVAALHSVYHHHTLVTVRNFYGTLRVQQTVTEHGDPIRTLMNGTIQHGTQIFSPDLRTVPTTYYARDSGVGLAMLRCCPRSTKRVGVVGLGAGTLAAYGNPGDSFRFYEINPAVLPIAQNLFTWLRDSKADITFAEGDARASLAMEAPQRFDILVLDAFSGDAIPLHLLTVEAMAIYRKHLAPGGILAFHVSNSYVNLEPEVAALAAAAHLQARSVRNAEDKQSGESRATWVLVTEDDAFFEQPAVALSAAPVAPRRGIAPWTDNYSSLAPLVRWGLER